MLIANGIRLASSNPMRTMGGASAYSIERSHYGKNGAVRNFWAGEGTMSGSASIADKNAFAAGYVHPYCWIMAPKSGGMACRIIAGSGDVTGANLAGGLNGVAALTGTGDITTATGSLVLYATASLTGSGAVTAGLAAIGYMASPLTGTGDITTATGLLALLATASLTGSGAITANASGSLSASASLTGSGDLTTTNLAGKLEATASLSGSGAVTANTTAIGHATAGLTGTGDITTASINGRGLMGAALAGTGVLVADSTATAYMTAEITVTGDLLSTANVGDAVWSTLLEAGFDASQIVRIIAAATAGASSGGPGSPVFRNLGDTLDQITGTADSSGDRSAITYGD